MTDTLITEVQQGIIDQVDSTALDIIIWSYLNNPNNDFMDQDRVETITDATACTIVYDPVPLDQTSAYDTTGTCVYIDTTTVDYIDTTSLWTVEQWKAVYLENTNNDAMISQDKIAYTDSNSPNYPLVDWNNKLFTFDTTSSVDFAIVQDSTSEYFIQYAHRVARAIDGMYIQPGLNGVDSTSGDADLAFFVGFSNNGTDWNYFVNDGSGVSILGDKQDGIDNPFYVNYTEAEITPQNVSELMFTDTAIEAKYWRIYFVEGTLGSYTASVSHLRFEQIREHGKAVITKTVDLEKTIGSYASGFALDYTDISGATWWTGKEVTFLIEDAKEALINIHARVWTDSTAEFRVRVDNEGGGFVEKDIMSLDEPGYEYLLYSEELINPSDDIEAVWTVKVDIQDRSAIGGSADVKYRFVPQALFRSTEEQ